LGNDTYKVGATYEWKDLSDATSEAGKLSLIQKLSKITTRPYKIEAHEAGVRPSSIDRRPIIGKHPEHPQLYIFNGLGAKGVMLAPYFTENFVHCYLQKQTLPAEVDVKRFYHMYESSTTK
jgi:glycine/D-amino acid oxidase-like deaminating enzyme